MDACGVLKKYFNDPVAFALVLEHSRMVADKALAIAASANARVDFTFIEEAALLHDIGVARIYSPRLGCFGNAPYICHGVLGREILEGEGLPNHAMVCERHIGVGLTADDIIRQKLPLPAREMIPLTLEEKIICFADLFYSKNPGSRSSQKSIQEIRAGLKKFGDHKVTVFDQWLNELGMGCLVT
jgi:uncharacterized protein